MDIKKLTCIAFMFAIVFAPEDEKRVEIERIEKEIQYLEANKGAFDDPKSDLARLHGALSDAIINLWKRKLDRLASSQETGQNSENETDETERLAKKARTDKANGSNSSESSTDRDPEPV